MLTQKEIDGISDAGKMIFCFDIDGVVCNLVSLSEQTPRQDVINLINERYNNGHHIILYTARDVVPKTATEKWLKDHGVLYHELQYGKPKAHIYIDDSAVNVRDYVENPESYDRHFHKIGDYFNAMCREKK